LDILDLILIPFLIFVELYYLENLLNFVNEEEKYLKNKGN